MRVPWTWFYGAEGPDLPEFGGLDTMIARTQGVLMQLAASEQPVVRETEGDHV
jgi:hypothetical protein